MPYLIVDKTVREVVATSLIAPYLTDPNLLVVKVMSVDNYTIRRWDQSQGEYDPETDSYPIIWTWVSGTSFTQEEVDREVTRQANQKARLEIAVNNAISSVNGKLITELTAIDLRNILAIFMVKEDWIDSTGEVTIPTDVSLLIK